MAFGWPAVRALLLLASTAFFFTAIYFIPLADATAISFISPLLLTVLAIPLLGERVGPRRWAAVVIGLIGALIIIRPGFGTLSWAAILPVITAICYALYQITTRMLAEIDPPITTFFYSGAVGSPPTEVCGWTTTMTIVRAVRSRDAIRPIQAWESRIFT